MPATKPWPGTRNPDYDCCEVEFTVFGTQRRDAKIKSIYSVKRQIANESLFSVCLN
jgi:hypothetical protein